MATPLNTVRNNQFSAGGNDSPIDLLNKSAPVVAINPVRQGLVDVVNKFPVENRLAGVRNVLKSKNLAGSFTAHVEHQLRNGGKIYIGVMDTFAKGETHGTNVEARIRANAPEYLRDRIVIVRYNTAGLNREQLGKLMQQMAGDASSKKIVALSVSGGLEAYGVNAIQTWTGKPLNKSTAGQGFEATAQRAKLSATERAGWDALAKASRVVPIATAVWNNGTTTLAAMKLASSNGVVATIDKGGEATEVPLFDIRMPAQVGNKHSSQSPPTFIGQALGMFSKEAYLKTFPKEVPQPGRGSLPVYIGL
jgi:hypothetical protein